MFWRLGYRCLQLLTHRSGMLRDFTGWVGVSWARCPAGVFPRCSWVAAMGLSGSAQPASTATMDTAATMLLPALPAWHRADRCSLTAIKDSRRHFIDEWAVDACLLVSCGKQLWCRILYSSQSSLEKVSSLPFWSFCKASAMFHAGYSWFLWKGVIPT